MEHETVVIREVAVNAAWDSGGQGSGSHWSGG